jgi:hypothetical protein
VTRTIEGLKCVAVPVQNSEGRSVGTDWVSREYDITIRSERDILSPQTGLVTGLVVEELTDIRLGVEPSTEDFTMPAGYKQVGGRSPN